MYTGIEERAKCSVKVIKKQSYSVMECVYGPHFWELNKATENSPSATFYLHWNSFRE